MPSEKKVVLVTGAGRGIGEAMAYAFAGGGADLVLVARTLEEIQRVAAKVERSGVSALPISADVSDPPAAAQVVATAIREFGQIDVLVNCAGIYGPIGRFVDNQLEEWERAIRINLLGTVYFVHAVVPHMMRRRQGVVINLSGGGAVSPFPRFSAYSASKAAVVRLTETLSVELQEYNIRVNAIAPGAVNTRLLEEVLAAGENAGADFHRKALEQKEKGGASPEVAAELAVFLASAQAQDITGRLISAVWDDWRSLDKNGKHLSSSAMFTLRRIDGRHFKET